MANFDEHLNQAKKNLSFLNKINKECNDYWDWQVTVCFYTAVHLANAHLANTADAHYRTHSQVKNALNPENLLSITKFAEQEYLAYSKLLLLSRRSRYLCHDSQNNKSADVQFTYDVHFIKALKIWTKS